MRFEDHLDRQLWLTWARDEQWRRARRTREERRRRQAQLWWYGSILAWALCALALLILFWPGTKAAATELKDTPVVESAGDPAPVETLESVCKAYIIKEAPAPEPEPVEETPEPEPIYYDVELSHELQDALREVCETSGVPFELALSVIWKETNYRNLVGDKGKSFGYMQVQPRWHSGRMEKLGVDDLMDPVGNFKVGCDFLAELLGRYPVTNALAYYNSGSPKVNTYAEKVMDYMETLT